MAAAPLIAGSDRRAPRQEFDFSTVDPEKDREYAQMRRFGQGMGAVWLATGIVVFVLGPQTVLRQSTTFVPVVVGLFALGLAFIVLGFVTGRRTARGAVVDDDGVRLRMSRPPEWSLRWDAPGSWIRLTRGYRRDSQEETESPGWIFESGRFHTDVKFAFGRTVQAAASTKGYRVTVTRRPLPIGDRELELVAIDHPRNPERVGGTGPFVRSSPARPTAAQSRRGERS